MITDLAAANQRVTELQEEVAFLQEELGLRTDEVKVARLARLFRGRGQDWNLGPQGAWILIALYGAGARGLATFALVDNMPRQYRRIDEPDQGCARVYVHRIRKLIGKDCIETLGSNGYALTAAGRAKVEALLARADETGAAQ